MITLNSGISTSTERNYNLEFCEALTKLIMERADEPIRLPDELKKLMLKPTRIEPQQRRTGGIPQDFSNGSKYLSREERGAYKSFISEYLVAKGFQINAKDLTNCPFTEHHNNGDKHPSAQVNQDFLYCFTAGRAYDIWDVAKQLNSEDFKAACTDVVNTLEGDKMDTPTQEELREMTRLDCEQAEKEIEKEKKKGEEKHYCSYEKFEDAIINYEPEKDFRPSLLCGCACPDGSISVIAARPGGGKTSSMINIVRETLMSNTKPERKKRKILYVNLEMNYKQILTNLHLSCIYDFATEEEKEELKTLKKTIFAFNNTVKGKEWKDEYWVIDEDEFPQPVDDDLKQAFEKNYLKAKELIKNSMHNNELKIYDGIGKKFENIKTEIEKQSEAGTLILLDYVQRLPDTKEATSLRYLQIQKASAELLKMVIEKQLIVITGAQLNRGTKGEPPTMGNIRESGDIEQDAHNVVILDKDYAKVEKAREGYSASQKMTINTVKQFVFWETSGEYGPTQKDDNKARLIEKRKKLYDNFMPAKSDTEDTLQ